MIFDNEGERPELENHAQRDHEPQCIYENSSICRRIEGSRLHYQTNRELPCINQSISQDSQFIECNHAIFHDVGFVLLLTKGTEMNRTL
jgi:hypothetical protein